MSTGINLKDARPNVKNPSGNFDLSHRAKFDFQIGRLIPSLCLPTIPGDDIYLSFNQLIRMAPFVSQVYQDFVVSTDFYFVPNRLLWHNFSNFMTAGYNGKREYAHPYIDGTKLVEAVGNVLPQSQHNIFNYMDIPNIYWGATSDHSFTYPLNALPWAAYMRVYLDYWLGVGQPINELYERLVSADNTLLTEGDNSLSLVQLYAKLASGDPEFRIPDDPGEDFFDNLFSPLYRLYPLDYFTQSRPDPQLGPVMTIPLKLVNTDSDGNSTFELVNTSSSSGGSNLRLIQTANSKNTRLYSSDDSSNVVTINASVFNNVASINDFYSAARVQELLTLYGYSGFMPQDTLAAEFGVNNPDKSLQRSQFLHHHQEDIEIGEVFSNNVNLASGVSPAEGADIPGVGTAIAKSTSHGRGFAFKNCEEYGFIIGLTSVYPKAGYSQGIPKMYRRLDRFDYPHPLLSELGMESIKTSELCISSGNFGHWEDDFSYNPRYSDYKVGIDRDRGEFRGNLQYLSDTRRIDDVYAVFNDQFLRVIPSRNHLNRPFNVQSYLPYSSPIFADIKFNISAHRQLPYYGLPRF